MVDLGETRPDRRDDGERRGNTRDAEILSDGWQAILEAGANHAGSALRLRQSSSPFLT